MSGTALPRTRVSAEERRSRLLSTAAAEFAMHGYGSASLRKIAASAGVTTPVIYDHFDSKGELYAAVVQQQADSLLAHWAAPPPGSPEEVFRATVDRIFCWIEEHPHGWRVLFADAPGDPHVAATLTAVQDRATAMLAEVFAALPVLEHSGGLTRERADAAYAEAARSAVDGLAAWWWRNGDVPRITVVALAASLLWRGLAETTQAGTQGEEPA